MPEDWQITLLWLCALAALLVFGALLYSTVAHAHARSSAKARECAWTLIPILIVIAAAAPALRGAGASASIQLAESPATPCLAAVHAAALARPHCTR